MRQFHPRPIDLAILNMLARCAAPPRTTSLLLGLEQDQTVKKLPTYGRREIRNALARMRRYNLVRVLRAYHWRLTPAGYEMLDKIDCTPACPHCHHPYARMTS